MINYNLKCENDHRFDSWFQSADAFEKLLSAGMATCPVCGTAKVEKAPMAPRVRPARNAAKPTLSGPMSPAEQAIAEMRKEVEANSENVGENFALEARRIHEGDAPERSIYGKAKPNEAKELIEDGIPVTPLPWGDKKGN